MRQKILIVPKIHQAVVTRGDTTDDKCIEIGCLEVSIGACKLHLVSPGSPSRCAPPDEFDELLVSAVLVAAIARAATPLL